MNQPKKAANSVDLPSVNLLGANAYGEPSVESGNMLNLRVSSDNEYIISIRDTSSGEVFTKQHGSPKKNQPIYPGSFVLIEKQLDPSQLIRNLTLECWVRPFDPSIRSQGLITQYSHLKKGAHEQCGVGLFLENQVPAFYVGDGLDFNVAYRIEGGFDFSSLTLGQWHHIVGVCAEGKVQLWCDGRKSGIVAQAPDDAKAGTAPLMLGRFGELNNNRCLDGDLAMPVIYARALGDDESNIENWIPSVQGDREKRELGVAGQLWYNYFGYMFAELRYMNFGKALGWTLVAFGVMGVLGNIAADPHVPWHWRKVARAIEGNIYQDIITGQFYLL